MTAALQGIVSELCEKEELSQYGGVDQHRALWCCAFEMPMVVVQL